MDRLNPAPVREDIELPALMRSTLSMIRLLYARIVTREFFNSRFSLIYPLRAGESDHAPHGFSTASFLFATGNDSYSDPNSTGNPSFGSEVKQNHSLPTDNPVLGRNRYYTFTKNVRLLYGTVTAHPALCFTYFMCSDLLLSTSSFIQTAYCIDNSTTLATQGDLSPNSKDFLQTPEGQRLSYTFLSDAFRKIGTTLLFLPRLFCRILLRIARFDGFFFGIDCLSVDF